jgi:hypothetical protein
VQEETRYFVEKTNLTRAWKIPQANIKKILPQKEKNAPFIFYFSCD